MCESNVFLIKDGKESKYLEDVEQITSENGYLFITNIDGKKRKIKAEIISINFEQHKLIIQERK
ncbi:MAG: CooT family nickel-binding protein [Planctomycetota bacterium]